MHLYGDLYSSPGLDLRQKQLLACAYLGQVNMPEQLLGHCIAVRSLQAALKEVQWVCLWRHPGSVGVPPW
jgi:hypothetical protein